MAPKQCDPDPELRAGPRTPAGPGVAVRAGLAVVVLTVSGPGSYSGAPLPGGAPSPAVTVPARATIAAPSDAEAAWAPSPVSLPTAGPDAPADAPAAPAPATRRSAGVPENLPISSPSTTRPPSPGPAPAGTAVEDIETILDTSGWGWRAAGITVRLGFHPAACCHWGVYDYRDRTIWIGPSAHRHRARLRYVALHELAHAWVWLSGKAAVVSSDLAPWRRSGIDPAELAADCIALLWGAGPGHYWHCPPDARTMISRRLRGEWD